MSDGYKLLAALVVAIALAVGGYFFGRHVRDGEIAQQMIDAMNTLADQVREAQGKADDLSKELSAQRSAATKNNRLITREITRYVEVTPATDRVLLPDTWRVRHNLAATGANPEAGPVAAGSTGPVEDAAALAAIDENYAICRESADKLAGWRKYWAIIDPLKAGQ
jgi:type II secretory pathway pseudopilin PulG